MKIVLLDEAQRRFEAEDRWWRENRDAKELLVTEFQAVLRRLSSTPDVGQRYRRSQRKLIQRVLMTKVRCQWTTFTSATSSRIVPVPQVITFVTGRRNLARAPAQPGNGKAIVAQQNQGRQRVIRCSWLWFDSDRSCGRA